MPITKKDVLDVLGDSRLRNIRFFVGPINVNSDEYDRVSDYIEFDAIHVKPGSGTLSHYYPEIDTLVTRDGDPSDIRVRTNLLHECTHMITDINQYDVGRLVDETAAYLAQLAYAFILMPSMEEPPLGSPLNNVTRLVMHLVTKYHLGESAGNGAIIGQNDISDLARAVHTLPDYSNVGETEKVKADGVSSADEAFYRFQVSRMMGRTMDKAIADDIERMLSEKVRAVAYENYVTSDAELLALFQSYGHGGAKRNNALERLTHIFLTIDQPSAGRLVQRLSKPSKTDTVADRFQSVFSQLDRLALLAALRITR